MTSERHQKKIAVINDLSGYGRCSLTGYSHFIGAQGTVLSGAHLYFIQSYRFPGVFFRRLYGKDGALPGKMDGAGAGV